MDSQPAALLIAHPAHELLLYRWLEQNQPKVHVLTTGAGKFNGSRLARTRETLDKLACPVGNIFGPFDDPSLYRMLLEQKFDRLIDATLQLAQSLIDDQTEVVVGDAAEGEILTHDIWRAMIDSAVFVASSRSNRPIANLEFAIESNDAYDLNEPSWHNHSLSSVELTAKWEAIDAYVEVTSERTRLLEMRGVDFVQREVIRTAPECNPWLNPLDAPTGYELHGMDQVTNGRYEQAISHSQHVVPFVRALENACGRYR